MPRVGLQKTYIHRASKDVAPEPPIHKFDDPLSDCRGTGEAFPIVTDRPRFQTSERSKAPLVVALIDGHDFTRSCVGNCLRLLDQHIVVDSFSTVDLCLATKPHNFKLVFYYLHVALDSSVVATITKLKQQLNPTPVMVVSDVETDETVMEALAAGARGYLPAASTNLDVAVEVMRVVLAGGIFVPVSAALMELARTRACAPTNLPPDQFTPRQAAVLGHLLKGDANKVIAHELSMSESTVKIHVRNIMKKMHATNRMQAVFRAYNFSDLDQTEKPKPLSASAD